MFKETGSPTEEQAAYAAACRVSQRVTLNLQLHAAHAAKAVTRLRPVEADPRVPRRQPAAAPQLQRYVQVLQRRLLQFAVRYAAN